MAPARRGLLQLALVNIAIFTFDAAMVWLVLWLAWGLTVKNWWWLIGIGVLGRWIHHCAIGMYRLELERKRRASTRATFGTEAAVELELASAKRLLAMFGNEASTISVFYAKDGHSGRGVYAFFSEYPEEGSVLLTRPIDNKRDG